MSVLNKEDFFSKIKARIGDDSSDDALSFIEDMTDTFNDLESRTNDSENWKQKYDDLDKTWREKYRARFFDAGTTPDDVKDDQKDDVLDDAEEKDFDDLFTEREG